MEIKLEFIVLLAGAVVSIAAACGVFYRIFKKAVSTISNDVLKQVTDTLEQNFLQKINTVNDTLKQNIEENRERDEATLRLTLKTTAARIFEAHRHYMKRGSITTFELAILEDLFTEYEHRKGNGHAKVWMGQIRTLPIIDHPSSAEEMNK